MITHVVLSHPDELSDWGRLQINQPHFRAWLRRSHETLSEGDQFEEFVDTGCCGGAHYVPFVVTDVHGDGTLTESTTIEYTTHPAADATGGWGATETIE